MINQAKTNSLLYPERASEACCGSSNCHLQQSERFTLVPAKQQTYIQALESKGVDWILLSNRNTEEYVAKYSGLDYHRSIYKWIERNYEVTREFGYFGRTNREEFGLQVYHRRLTSQK